MNRASYPTIHSFLIVLMRARLNDGLVGVERMASNRIIKIVTEQDITDPRWHAELVAWNKQVRRVLAVSNQLEAVAFDADGKKLPGLWPRTDQVLSAEDLELWATELADLAMAMADEPMDLVRSDLMHLDFDNLDELPRFVEVLEALGAIGAELRAKMDAGELS